MHQNKFFNIWKIHISLFTQQNSNNNLHHAYRFSMGVMHSTSNYSVIATYVDAQGVIDSVD